MPQNSVYALTMLLAGIGIPLLAALSARLGQRIEAPIAAALVLFGVALVATIGALIVSGQAPALSKLPDAPRHLFLAGVLMAFYAISITLIAPRFGVGNAVFFVLLGQLISAAAIDHFGLFGARPAAIGLYRAAGIALMAMGVYLTQKA